MKKRMIIGLAALLVTSKIAGAVINTNNIGSVPITVSQILPTALNVYSGSTRYLVNDQKLFSEPVTTLQLQVLGDNSLWVHSVNTNYTIRIYPIYAPTTTIYVKPQPTIRWWWRPWVGFRSWWGSRRWGRGHRGFRHRGRRR